jgi:GNAT superfamily N-acetyltransferase
MSDKVLSPVKTLAKANEANMYALTPFFHDWPRVKKYSGPDLSWCVTDIPFPWCNVAFNARLEPGRADRAIQAFADVGRKRNVPVCWWIGPETTPVDLSARLKAHGFVKRGDTTLMAIDLYAMNEDGPEAEDLAITQVEDRDALRLWCSVTAAGFAIPLWAEPFLFEWFSTAVGLRLPMQFYLGWVRGLPVATSLLFLAEGVAGLYFVATLPAARRQGIGFAITLAPLREARRMGFGMGVLQASKMGESVYRKMGFRQCSTMTSYIRMHEVF